MHVHPEFHDAESYLDNDIVILKIKGSSSKSVVRLNKNENIPLSSTSPFNQSSNSQSKPTLTVLGWGSLDVHGMVMANVLQRVDLHHISNQDCLDLFGDPVITDRMMCAIDLDGDNIVEDSCYGTFEFAFPSKWFCCYREQLEIMFSSSSFTFILTMDSSFLSRRFWRPVAFV